MGWQEAICHRGKTIRDAIEAIDVGAIQICLVTDSDNRLVGTITDGDVRRALLRGIDVTGPLEQIVNATPVTARAGDTNPSIIALMNRTKVRQVPILDADGRIVDVALEGEIESPAVDGDNLVVLMAGGLGMRLRPLTNDIPKPLLPVGNKPLLQTILEGFVDQGFTRFMISVNYKAETIKAHFGDGSPWNVAISYLEEDEQLGTAGALRLLPERPEAPFVVMNGDLLTKVNYRHLLSFHKEQDARATMCVREYEYEVPFGVVELSENRVTNVDEKPLVRSFINAGIYALDPDVLELIPPDGKYDMTTLFQTLAGSSMNTAAFPVREYWLDVGHAEDLARADGEYRKVFQK